MLKEIRDELGFTHMELGHGTRISLMPGIQKMRERGEVTFSSLHNFCPLPVEVTHASPDIYKFSAGTTAERERAVKQTLNTIDFAERLGGKTAPWHPVTCEETLAAAVHAIGTPSILKTCMLGYDGKGQTLIGRAEDIPTAWESIG